MENKGENKQKPDLLVGDVMKNVDLKHEGNNANTLLAVRCFSHEELQAIKTDCFHILKSIDLSKEHRDIRDSVIDKIEQELQESKKNIV